MTRLVFNDLCLLRDKWSTACFRQLSLCHFSATRTITRLLCRCSIFFNCNDCIRSASIYPARSFQFHGFSGYDGQLHINRHFPAVPACIVIYVFKSLSGFFHQVSGHQPVNRRTFLYLGLNVSYFQTSVSHIFFIGYKS